MLHSNVVKFREYIVTVSAWAVHEYQLQHISACANMCMVYVRACMRACVHACVRAYVYVCVWWWCMCVVVRVICVCPSLCTCMHVCSMHA